MSEATAELTALGRRVTEFERLETFQTPKGVTRVTLDCDEVTAVCPVTGQPDYYDVEISYNPDKKCVESKTVKLLLQEYRQKGLFCEAFAADLAGRFSDALETGVSVTVKQKSRGGISITARAFIPYMHAR